MKIAIVTGASSGMGKESVCELAKHFGALDEIWAVARRKERLEELSSLVSVPVRVLALDLGKQEDLETLSGLLEKEKPQVKFLINGAGFGKIGSCEHLSVSDQTGMVNLNCLALTAVTSMVLPYMPENSRIIQYASSAAFLPQPDFAVYAATKAYVLSYSRALNRELKKRRICVTAVCPGPVKTEFFDIAETTGNIALYKRLVMANSRRVVKKALRDSIAKREVSVYGFTMKAFRLLCKVVPHRFLLDIMEKIEHKGENICRN